MQGETRALRIGLFDHDHLLAERIVRRPSTVSIGRAPDNTFQIDAPKCPRHFPLVERALGHCWLNFTDEMHGEVELDGLHLTLDELSSVAEEHHGLHRVELQDGSRARIDFGEQSVVVELEPGPARPRSSKWPAVGALATVTLLGALALLAALALVNAHAMHPRARLEPMPQVIKLPPLVVTVSMPPPDDAVAAPPEMATELERRRGMIDAAYRQARSFRPELAGEIEVRFHVDRDGRVRAPEIVRDTLGWDEVGEQLRANMATWRLPVRIEAAYKYTFTFAPAQRLPAITL
jgi:hypothetical protein